MSKQAKIELAKTAVQPMLLPGERIEIVTVAMFGRFSTAKGFRFGIVVAILTLGLFYGLSAPKKRWLVVTDSRLIFLEMNSTSGKPTEVIAWLYRSVLRTEAQRTRRAVLFVPMLEVDLATTDGSDKVRLTFPTPCRKDGRALATMLGSADAPKPSA